MVAMFLLIGCGTFGLDALSGDLDSAVLTAEGAADPSTGETDSPDMGTDSAATNDGDTSPPTEDTETTADPGTGSDSMSSDCGELDVDWQPAVSADYIFYIEYTEADGDVAVPWVAVDAEEGLGAMGASMTVCGGTVRFIGAGDRDGDGADDTWSAMVSGDGCVEVGEVTCSWNGSPIDDSNVRRSDGCSNICEVP